MSLYSYTQFLIFFINKPLFEKLKDKENIIKEYINMYL